MFRGVRERAGPCAALLHRAGRPWLPAGADAPRHEDGAPAPAAQPDQPDDGHSDEEYSFVDVG
eukprot:5987002-Pyramimonas_sp.AAC.1